MLKAHGFDVEHSNFNFGSLMGYEHWVLVPHCLFSVGKGMLLMLAVLDFLSATSISSNRRGVHGPCVRLVECSTSNCKC